MKKHRIYLFVLVISAISLCACLQPFTEPASNQVTAPVTSAYPHAPEIQSNTYTIVDTGQDKCYEIHHEIPFPNQGDRFYGQDAQYRGKQPAYKDNSDGTVTDLNTGLMWIKERGGMVSWEAAMADAKTCRTGGYTDWRMPSIKELYSLINFTGKAGITEFASIPYLNTSYFEFKYGNVATGSRLIDCQDWTSTEYVSTTMNGDATVFGVNFADGRIKGYGKSDPRTGKQKVLYIRYVRGNQNYGVNSFSDNSDGTITDKATGLMWSKSDSNSGMDWIDALAWIAAKNSANYLGYNDWRLPNAKELQSIVDYTRAPDITNSAAINPLFNCTSIVNEGGKADYPFYWTGTTHLDNMAAVYITFGRALGYMEIPPNSGKYILFDVHGAGAQRSDPKSGNASAFPHGLGPQGDVIRILNFVRCVRDAG